MMGDEARISLYKGVELVNKAVSITLGPAGRNALLEYEVGHPKITKDGVTVGKNIMLKNR